jgi:carbon-monoxide dehydrogenase large subunit
MEAGLEAVNYYDPPNLTFPFGTYVCVVDIDRGTGEVKIRRFVSIDDCGNIINPMVVQGQIHGGLTMGMAPALLEEISYDENGNVSGGSFMDYLVPTAMELPPIETVHLEYPSPRNPLGLKGIGEGGAISPPAAIANAVEDALAPFGVRVTRTPLGPSVVLGLLEQAAARTGRPA